MSNLSRFLKQNKVKKENVKYAATASLTDENGNPLEWVIKALTTKENEAIRDECTIEVPVIGKPGMYRPKVDTNMYLTKTICKAVVEPDLYNKELQDSYGVMTPEELLVEMVDNPGEFNALASFVQDLSGFNTGLAEKVDQAKN